jgi:hypothetical protein
VTKFELYVISSLSTSLKAKQNLLNRRIEDVMLNAFIKLINDENFDDKFDELQHIGFENLSKSVFNEVAD